VVLPFLARRRGKPGEYDNVVAEIGKQVPIFSTMVKGQRNKMSTCFEILSQSDAYLPGLSFWTGHAADVDALTVALALYLLANLEDQETDRFERYQCQSISVHIHIRPQKDSGPMMS
jgi:hypothetical protein